MRNSYGGSCRKCGLWTEPNDGTIEKIGSSWEVICDPCMQEPEKDLIVEADGRPRGTPEEAWAKLWKFQKEGVAWLAARDAGLEMDQQGLGKTVQALCAVGSIDPVLVVCRASLKLNWQHEAKKWRLEHSVRIIWEKGPFSWPQPGEILITSYEIIPDIESATENPFAEPHPGTILIADEVQDLANYKSKRTERFRAISARVRIRGGQAWGLTGSPLMARPEQLWGVLQSIGNLGFRAYGSFDEFRVAYGGVQNSMGGTDWVNPIQPDAHKKLRTVALGRLRNQVDLDLPDKIYKDLPVQIDKEAIEACEVAMRKLVECGALTEEEFDVEKLMRSTEFQEISRARSLLSAAKIPAMMEVVEQYEDAGEPLVVFCSHRAAPDKLVLRKGWARVSGAETAKQKHDRIQRFQKGELFGLVCMIKAAGVGHNITRGHHALFVDCEWNPSDNEQAEDRLCRIGQKAKGVIITRLVADHPLDRRLTQILLGKERFYRDIIDAARGEDPAILVGRVLMGLYKLEHGRPYWKAKPPMTLEEEWAGNALLTIVNPRNAMTLEGEYRNYGSGLADQLESGFRATPIQWETIINVARASYPDVGTGPNLDGPPTGARPEPEPRSDPFDDILERAEIVSLVDCEPHEIARFIP